MTHPDSLPTTNRATRRAQARQRRKATPVRRVDLDAPMRKLINAAPHSPAEVAGEHVKLRECFNRLQGGLADTDDFDHLAMTINMCKVRAMSIDETLADMLERAQDAMGRCKDRYMRSQRFGFDGPGLQQVLDSLDACEAIITASSPLQMRRARDVVTDQLLGKGAAARLTQWARHARMGRSAAA